MYSFTGIKASPGVAVGPVQRIEHGTTGLHRIVGDPFRERALYEAAIVLAKDELYRLQQRMKGGDADILAFQIALLEDESFTNEIGDYIAVGAGVAAAVERAEQIFSQRLKDVESDYIRERAVDVCDVCRRVVDILDGRPRRRLHLDQPSILVSDRFFPSDLFVLDRRMILGLASDNDSETSHAAIMARNMGIPAVVGLGNGVADLAVGHRAIVDGETGCFIIEPTAKHLAAADRQIAELRRRHEIPDPLAALPNLSRDGVPFKLFCTTNLTDPAAIGRGLRAGAVGVGMVRSESAIMEDVDEQWQYNSYRAILAQAEGTPVAVRTCDPGADDDAPWTEPIRDRLGGHRLYQPQIRALLRAGTEGDLRVLLPLIHDADEWDECMAEVEVCKHELEDRGQRYRRDLPFGCVIDVPSAALLAGEIMDHGAQFLAIDVDDLTRYTCGLSRNDMGYRADSTAVLRLVTNVVTEAGKRGVSVYINGITSAELPAVPAFFRAGARRFCTEVAMLPMLKSKLLSIDSK